MVEEAPEITEEIGLREASITAHRERMAARIDADEQAYAGDSTMTTNERTARTFAEQFTPPLNVCATERINNMPVPDAWAISYHDGARGLGITAVAFHGGLHAYLEAAGKGDIAEHAGQVLAKALGLFQAEKST